MVEFGSAAGSPTDSFFIALFFMTLLLVVLRLFVAFSFSAMLLVVCRGNIT